MRLTVLRFRALYRQNTLNTRVDKKKNENNASLAINFLAYALSTRFEQGRVLPSHYICSHTRTRALHVYCKEIQHVPSLNLLCPFLAFALTHGTWYCCSTQNKRNCPHPTLCSVPLSAPPVVSPTNNQLSPSITSTNTPPPPTCVPDPYQSCSLELIRPRQPGARQLHSSATTVPSPILCGAG